MRETVSMVEAVGDAGGLGRYVLTITEIAAGG
jgi:hypothetical protein